VHAEEGWRPTVFLGTSSDRIGYGAPVYLADTDEQAVDEARPYRTLFPPGAPDRD